MKKTIAAIVVFTRADQTTLVWRGLKPQLTWLHELVVVDDGVGEPMNAWLEAVQQAFPNVIVIRYPKSSFYLGAWKPVIDGLSSTYLYFITSGVLPASDFLHRVLEASDRFPECGMLYGCLDSCPEHMMAGEATRQDAEQFAKRVCEDASLGQAGPLAAVFAREAWVSAGGYRWELAGGHAWVPFLQIGLTGESVRLSGDCGIKLSLEPWNSVYGEVQPYRCLDDLARIHFVVHQSTGSSAIDRWLATVREAVIDDAGHSVSGGLVHVNKTIDRFRKDQPRGLTWPVSFLQRGLGLLRRPLSGFVRRAAAGYQPDTECFGWIKPSFSFGVNWGHFIKTRYNDERLAIAQKDILDFLGVSDLTGQAVVDIGCGSGIHSLGVVKAGASKVFSFDYDIESVKATRNLHALIGSPSHWMITQGSILDPEFVNSIEKADLVYSWGVLHHTGRMWDAIRAAASVMKEDGLLFIALYTKWPGSDDAVRLKIRYNRAGWFHKRLMELNLMRSGVPGLSYLFKDFAHFRSRLRAKVDLMRNYQQFRGMSFYHDIVDWLGGYPYEDALPEEVVWFCEKTCGLSVVKVVDRGGNLCSHYLFRKADSSPPEDGSR